jgi:hypothetical protein
MILFHGMMTGLVIAACCGLLLALCAFSAMSALLQPVHLEHAVWRVYPATVVDYQGSPTVVPAHLSRHSDH